MTISTYHISKDLMLEEAELIKASKKDPARFAPLYERYHEPIFRFIYQRMDDKDQAFDLTAQVFLKALSNLHRYEDKGVPFASWLYRIARNEVYQLFKDRKAVRTLNIESVQITEMFSEMEAQNTEEHHRLLLDTIKDLPDDDLQLIEMRFFESKPFKEIAEILAITENNAKVKLYRILDRMKLMFQQKSKAL
ncbi:MAG: RNA polymerase sigma factor [Cytophagaceae bacterium]